MTPTSSAARLSAVVALPVALCLSVAGRALTRADLDVYDTRDEALFHHPTVQAFAEALPAPDLSDYPSATGPLYHLLLAPISATTGDSLAALRLATLALALVGLLAAGALLARRSTQPWWGLSLLLLPLALSPYFLGPAVRLSTDDAALTFVLLALLALDGARDRGLPVGAVLLAALAAAAATLTRQVHGWLVGTIGLVAALSPALPLARRGATAALAALPVAALAPLALLWGGLTPPSFAEHQAGLNAAVLQTELAVLGALALPLAPWLSRALGPRRLPALGLAGALGAGLLLASPLPWAEDGLRYGGSLWRVCQAFPDVLGTTAPFWALVPLGLLALAAFLADARDRRDPLPAAALCCFLLANLASARAYQKYYEPLLLVLLGWLVARSPPAPRAWWWAGPALLALAWLAVAIARFVT